MIRPRGFTLVEMLVATMMLTLLTTAGFAVLSAGTRAANKSKSYDAMLTHGQAALLLLESDIRAAIFSDDIGMVSLDAEHEGLPADTLDFITAKTPRLAVEEEVIPVRRCEVGYYIENDPDTDYQWLLRREDGSLDDDPLGGGAATLVGPYVAAINFQFYDGLEWQSGWNDLEMLPIAIHIELMVVDPFERENPITLSTTVPVPVQ